MENNVAPGTYFQIIDPTVKTFGEVKEFTNMEIENDDTYLVFSDGTRCNSKLVLSYDVHFDSTGDLHDYHMAELASKEEKWITAILPGVQKVNPMNYFSSPDTMWIHNGRIDMEIPTPEDKTRVILIPQTDAEVMLAYIVVIKMENSMICFIKLSNIMTSSIRPWTLNSSKTFSASIRSGRIL